MLSIEEKEELKRIINKYVEQGRCLRPIHPDEALQEVKQLKPAQSAMNHIVPLTSPAPQ